MSMAGAKFKSPEKNIFFISESWAHIKYFFIDMLFFPFN